MTYLFVAVVASVWLICVFVEKIRELDEATKNESQEIQDSKEARRSNCARVRVRMDHRSCRREVRSANAQHSPSTPMGLALQRKSAR